MSSYHNWEENNLLRIIKTNGQSADPTKHMQFLIYFKSIKVNGFLKEKKILNRRKFSTLCTNTRATKDCQGDRRSPYRYNDCDDRVSILFARVL